jgi:hypothetical protein
MRLTANQLHALIQEKISKHYAAASIGHLKSPDADPKMPTEEDINGLAELIDSYLRDLDIADSQEDGEKRERLIRYALRQMNHQLTKNLGLV